VFKNKPWQMAVKPWLAIQKGWQLIYQAWRASEKPFIATHPGCIHILQAFVTI
jgi:hypothetical protein